MNKRDNICTYILAMESTEYTPSLRQWSFNYDGVWTNNRSRQRFGRISFWTDGRTNERTKFLFIHQAWNHLRGRMPVCLSVWSNQVFLSFDVWMTSQERKKFVWCESSLKDISRQIFGHFFSSLTNLFFSHKCYEFGHKNTVNTFVLD